MVGMDALLPELWAAGFVATPNLRGLSKLALLAGGETGESAGAFLEAH